MLHHFQGKDPIELVVAARQPVDGDVFLIKLHSFDLTGSNIDKIYANHPADRLTFLEAFHPTALTRSGIKDGSRYLIPHKFPYRIADGHR